MEGGTRSGKTKVLIKRFCQWLATEDVLGKQSHHQGKILVLAGNDESKRKLGDNLAIATRCKYPITAKTTIGFIQDEVLLFYPLSIEKLSLPAHIPLRLRPETEQELATKLWQPALARLNWREIASSEYRFVRRTLDLLLLAAYSCTPLEALPRLLAQGFGAESDANPIYGSLESLAAQWREWCLERGLLTYGIMAELYWRHLFPHPEYQRHLASRYIGMLGADVDDYPAIGRNLCEWLLDAGVWGAFSYNPDGMVRLGLSADPSYGLGLKSRCLEVINLDSVVTPLLANRSNLDRLVEVVLNPGSLFTLPQGVRRIETRTRGDMLQRVAQFAIDQIQTGKIQPQDIAIIAPGLDAIARYTITDMFDRHQIPIVSLNAQLPLNSDPGVRALLTLLALIYPGLGQMIDRNEIADLLVTLSLEAIDPVRAGLLADYCYAPDIAQPRLQPYQNFPRWDRLSAGGTEAYERILAWVDSTRHRQPSPLNLLNEAIDYFFQKGLHLTFDRLSALRELMETAEHYWQVVARTRSTAEPEHQIVAQFIILLRQGTISANPYPFGQLQSDIQAVTLSNIFQYRATKRSHSWHFWLDVGSPLWAEGGAATLYGANLFLNDRMGKLWTEADSQISDEQRLERILRDLCHRVDDRLYLCNSDLAIDGEEQVGPLLTLIHSVDRG